MPLTLPVLAGTVPQIRITACNHEPVQRNGAYVLYWMIAFRRLEWNFSLQRAVDWSRHLVKPLLVLEALRYDYRWASDRFHLFIMEGMKEHRDRLRKSRVTYYPFLEQRQGEGKGLIERLARDSCVIITDDSPAFFLPRMVEAASRRVPVLMEKVDSNGLLPVHSCDRVYSKAYFFRKFLQQTLPPHLQELPLPYPLTGNPLPELDRIPTAVSEQWPPCDSLLDTPAQTIRALPIDHSVTPTGLQGGTTAAKKKLKHFLSRSIRAYAEDRNEPERNVTSGLSPYLHFGHISSHEIFWQLMRQEDWSPVKLSASGKGSRSGWWGVSENSESFLDQLVTWRELGFNMASLSEDYDQFESLPEWAIETLLAHEGDPREHLYDMTEFERGKTHDPLWNAAQMQLVREGVIHNYLRMLWGKKVLEWTDHPRQALQIMIELNNKYALDGRDPNSYSGIFWVLGRYDRPWGHERPIFGKVRYMSSTNTARKYNVGSYIERYS